MGYLGIYDKNLYNKMGVISFSNEVIFISLMYIPWKAHKSFVEAEREDREGAADLSCLVYYRRLMISIPKGSL